MKKYCQEKTYKNVIGISINISTLQVFLFVLTSVMACKSPHPELRRFASAIAEDLKINVCGGKDVKHDPCGQRDVKYDADLGLCVYINVYGVTEKKEVERLVDFVKKYRGEEYKVIPIEIVFYADLEKSKIIYKEKIRGEK